MIAPDLVTTFYAEIEPLYSIVEITNPDHYRYVPDNWLVALTDVRGSTAAIEAGRYRDVNTVAAASITVMLNAVEGRDIPFVFGGDGATILIPPDCREAAAGALAAARELAQQFFDLELRVGIVPITTVKSAGYQVRVAKLWIGENFQQAIFDGGGLSYAESLLKHPEHGPRYMVPSSVAPEGDFHGFECRWNEVRSAHDETIALIVLATDEDDTRRAQTYRNILETIERIYGDRDTRHPISIHNLRMTFRLSSLSTESRVRHRTTSICQRLKMLWGSIKAWVAMTVGIGQWGMYKQFFVEATDHEKFDDTLRTIMSGTVSQRAELDAYLSEQHHAGRLVYGIHSSAAALVTCIVFDYFGRQVHFVDGAGGGYALAAKQMKAQLAIDSSS
jgi:hypothetical protein